MQAHDETDSDIAELTRRDFGYTPPPQNLKHAFLNWVHYRARRIPCRPRQIVMSAAVQARLPTYPAIGRICDALRAGEDVSAWLSRKKVTRKCNPRADMMFNDWQITHFHLGRVFAKPNMIGGADDLLYAHVSSEFVTLLDVLPHGSWAAQDLLRILIIC
jgi:hypothetical protein